MINKVTTKVIKCEKNNIIMKSLFTPVDPI